MNNNTHPDGGHIKSRSIPKRVAAAVVGVLTVYVGFFIGTGLGSWVGAAPFLLMAGWLILWSMPAHPGEYVFESLDLVRPEEYGEPRARLRCPCCNIPTLHPDENDTACTLCEWDSSDESSDPASLHKARQHFKQHGWAYDPELPPAWRIGPPSAEERDVMDELRAAYLSLADEPDRHWEHAEVVRDLEDHLVKLRRVE